MFKVGDILNATWGYDQTNQDFYRVVKRAKTMVTLQKLQVQHSQEIDFMTDNVMPIGAFDPYAKPIRRKVIENGNQPFVKITDYAYAYLWDGNPKRASYYA